jgi:hypothetical protein
MVKRRGYWSLRPIACTRAPLVSPVRIVGFLLFSPASTILLIGSLLESRASRGRALDIFLYLSDKRESIGARHLSMWG